MHIETELTESTHTAFQQQQRTDTLGPGYYVLVLGDIVDIQHNFLYRDTIARNYITI